MGIRRLLAVVFLFNVGACSEVSFVAKDIVGVYSSTSNLDERIIIKSDMSFTHSYTTEIGDVIENNGTLRIFGELQTGSTIGFNDFCPKHKCNNEEAQNRKSTTAFEIYKEGNLYKICHQIGSDNLNCFIMKN